MILTLAKAAGWILIALVGLLTACYTAASVVVVFTSMVFVAGVLWPLAALASIVIGDRR